MEGLPVLDLQTRTRTCQLSLPFETIIDPSNSTLTIRQAEGNR